MIGIYKIVNKINNKVYVGQAVDIKRRLSEHKSYSFNPNHNSYNYAIHRAIRKYGIENFSFEIIEECSIEQLDEREKYWIKQLNSQQLGYNMTEGGDTTANHWDREINQYTLEGKYLKTYAAIRQAARETGIDHALIGRCCNHKVSHAGGYLWSYVEEEVIIPSKPILRRKIEQIDLETGKVINVYNNAADAARALNKKSSTNIRNVCHGKQRMAYGYFWRYAE